MYNCPPTAFTVSFSNTAVDKVPLILTFSNSASPLFVEAILQPLTPLAKFDVSIVPAEFNIRFPLLSVVAANAQPPISPVVAVTLPANSAAPVVFNSIVVVSVVPCLLIIFKLPLVSICNLLVLSAIAPILRLAPKCDTPVPGSATVPSLKTVIPADDITALVFTSSPKAVNPASAADAFRTLAV